MKLILSILLFASVCQGQIDDKTKHFYAGFGITVVTAEITNQITDKPAISCLVGTAVGCLAGVLKETVYDREMKRGVYSNTDMGMTCWGSVVGAMVIRVRFDLQDKKKHKPIYKDYYN